MSIIESIAYNRNLLKEFRAHRERIRQPQEEFVAAQIAIIYVICALGGLVPYEKIFEAVGNARSPNAVSRALKSRLTL